MNVALVLLSLTPGGDPAFAAFPVPAAPPVRTPACPCKACGCGPCDCTEADRTPKPVPAAPAVMPAGASPAEDSYRYLLAAVRWWKPGPHQAYRLAVGVPNPDENSYLPRATVPAGFRGLASGVYLCWWDGGPVFGRVLDNPAPMTTNPAAAGSSYSAPAASPGCFLDPITGRQVCPLQRR